MILDAKHDKIVRNNQDLFSVDIQTFLYILKVSDIQGVPA